MILRPGVVNEGITQIPTLDIETDCTAPDGSRPQLIAGNPWHMDDAPNNIAQFYADRIDWCDANGIPMRATIHKGPGVDRPRALDKSWYDDRLSCLVAVTMARPHEELYVEGASNAWPQGVDLMKILFAMQSKIIAAQAIVPSNLATTSLSPLGFAKTGVNLVQANRIESQAREQYLEELGLTAGSPLKPDSLRKMPAYAWRCGEQVLGLLFKNYAQDTADIFLRQGVPVSVWTARKDRVCPEKGIDRSLEAVHFPAARILRLPTTHLGAMFDHKFTAALAGSLHRGELHGYQVQDEPVPSRGVEVVRPGFAKWREQLTRRTAAHAGQAALQHAS